MTRSFPVPARGLIRVLGASALMCLLALAAPAQAMPSAFDQAVAAAAASQSGVADFYLARGYATLWTGPQDQTRRQALVDALAQAGAQGLPAARYGLDTLLTAAGTAVTEGDRGRLEVAMTDAYLAYARDLSSGVLEPIKVDPGIVRDIKRPDAAALLRDIASNAHPGAYLRALAPHAPEYARLVKEKLRLEAMTDSDPAMVQAAKLKPGDSGAAVIALRDRLVSFGYMRRSATAVYDRDIQTAVLRFQADQGLNADGVAGDSTIAMLNMPRQDRLKAVVVALERLRWMGAAPFGKRHIWVNQPSFTAQIVDDGRVTFQTRVVIGRSDVDRRSPEFSDQMEFMVVNPSWGVPRSIIVKEYLPLLQKDPAAAGQLQLVDDAGRVIDRDAVDFAAYTPDSFPYGLRQPPSDGNALGKVKFMFPNPYNIYLHDTPDKGLFAKETRAFSHGCIRLGSPLDFAYTLLAAQTDTPKAVFAEHLATRKESTVMLDHPVPVHLVYFTAWPSAKGMMTYRRDVYGRDKRLFDALVEAGVVLPSIQG